jgi:hypothetical protein
MNTFDVCVTRGTDFALDAGLSAAFVEVIEHPNQWEALMVFEDTEEYLELRAPAEVDLSDPTVVPVRFFFRATPVETASLPDWRHRYTVNLIRKPEFPSVIPRQIERLFEGRVEVHD